MSEHKAVREEPSLERLFSCRAAATTHAPRDLWCLGNSVKRQWMENYAQGREWQGMGSEGTMAQLLLLC